KAGTKYYSYNAKKTLKIAKQTLYVNGKVYSGYYLNNKNLLYSVKKGTLTLKTGTVKAGTKYYSYNAKKTKKISKQTLYVKGKVYSGYYLNNKNLLYSVKKGTLTLKTGTVKAGTKYYSYNAKKTKKISKQTLYVKGKVYSGYYLNNKNLLYSVKKGTLTLKTGTVKAGTKYYSYNAKKTKKISKQTLYVKGKVYTGYYLDNEYKMNYVTNGTCALINATLYAGTTYYSFHDKATLTLSSLMVYVNGKAMEGMSPEALETLQRAQAVVNSITNDSMSPEEKLKACFDYVKGYGESRPRTPHYFGLDWPTIYANDMFLNGSGNCFSYASSFAYMAKAIGYEEVYCCNSNIHGWVEIDGLFYDPQWSRRQHADFFAISRGTPTYHNYGSPWMRIKI
ncbi:MAG: transglutaminase domain-containing protein, partial [Lachnospiraceae bacterium]|nr:transglutaminase domain-containing protein [Lachnospiraceae bacterium]